MVPTGLPSPVPDLGPELEVLRSYGRNAFSACLLYDSFSRYWCRTVHGFVGYLAGPSVNVVLGEPVCAPSDYLAAAREFSEHCRAQRADCLFAAVGGEFVDAVAADEAMVLPIGDDLVFDVRGYRPRGDRAKKIRSAVNQFAESGGRVKEYVRPVAADSRLEAALDSLVSSWMDGQDDRLHFMEVDLFRFPDLKRWFYAEHRGQIVGVLSCLPIFARQGMLFEDAIRHPDAPRGVVETLTLAAIEQLRLDGFRMATFGPSVRPRLDGSRNLTRFDRAIASLLVPLAMRFGRLEEHYHARKKFGSLTAEPIYLLMWPDDVSWSGLYRLLRLFHIV
jgi:phosphatidylglycerol lysyltransferase